MSLGLATVGLTANRQNLNILTCDHASRVLELFMLTIVVIFASWFLISISLALFIGRVISLKNPRDGKIVFFEKNSNIVSEYPAEVHGSTVRTGIGEFSNYASVHSLGKAIAPVVCPGTECVHLGMLQTRIAADLKEGFTTEELEELKELRTEVRELKEARKILKATSNLIAGEPDDK